MNLSAVILAGGKNSRMEGLDKAFLLIEGEPLIERLVKVLKQVFDEVVIVTNSPEKYNKNSLPSGVIITTDIIKDVGPIGGIYTGLKTIKNDAAFFVACDMPFLDTELIRRETEIFNNKNVDCLVARCVDKIHPLHSIYAKSALEIIPKVIESGNFAIMNLVDRCKNVSFVDFDSTHERNFTNINFAMEARKALTQFLPVVS